MERLKSNVKRRKKKEKRKQRTRARRAARKSLTKACVTPNRYYTSYSSLESNQNRRNRSYTFERNRFVLLERRPMKKNLLETDKAQHRVNQGEKEVKPVNYTHPGLESFYFLSIEGLIKIGRYGRCS